MYVARAILEGKGIMGLVSKPLNRLKHDGRDGIHFSFPPHAQLLLPIFEELADNLGGATAAKAKPPITSELKV